MECISTHMDHTDYIIVTESCKLGNHGNIGLYKAQSCSELCNIHRVITSMILNTNIYIYIYIFNSKSTKCVFGRNTVMSIEMLTFTTKWTDFIP